MTLWNFNNKKVPLKLKDEHRTSNVQSRFGVIEWEKIKKQTYDLEKRLLEYSVRIIKPELLDDILEETDELIKIFVASIKTVEKKPRLGVVEYSVLAFVFTFDVGVFAYLDVRCSMFDVHLSNNLAFRELRGVGKKRKCLNNEPMNVYGVSVDNAQTEEFVMIKISAVLFCIFLFLYSPALAATKEVITTGKYVMGDLDTKTKAKNFALLDAKKMAMEKAGTYLRSFSEVDGLHLTRDEVLSLAAGTMSVEILEETWDMQGQNPVITITIKAKIDTADLDKEIEALIAHRSKLKKFNQIEKTGDDTDNRAYSKATIIDSFLAYEISITQVKSLINTGGLMEVQLTGLNNTSSYKKLEYKIEWFDNNGFLIETIMSRWTDFPAYGNSEFGFKAVGPTTAATDFRIKIREED